MPTTPSKASAKPNKRLAKQRAREASPELQLKTRERILKVAMSLFADRGFAATTVAEIEAAAGLSPGSGALYRHFPSKNDILAAGISELRARIETNRAAAKAVSAGDTLPADDKELAQQLKYAHLLTLYGLDASREFVLTLMRSGSSVPPEVLATSSDWLDESILSVAENFRQRHRQTGIEVLAGDDTALAYLLMAPIMWSKTLEWNGGLPAGLTHERIGDMWVKMLVRLTGEQGNRSGLAPKVKPTRKRTGAT